MRIAIIFPPQWDPRQPPLAPALLNGVIKSTAVDTKVFDLNIALYRNLIKSEIPGGIEDFLVNRLLNPTSLCDAKNYIQTSESIQKIFDERFDEKGMGRLFWDDCQGTLSTESSTDWQKSLSKPNVNLFLQHLENEIKQISNWQPDIIAISAISDTQLHASLALAKIFRSALPNSKIILGGKAITYRRSILPKESWLGSTIDYFCLGDGEPLMEELATASSNNVFSSVTPNGLSWNKAEKACTVTSKLQDLSDLHFPDFNSLPLKQYLTPHIVIPIETARGCPWGKCAYCIHPVQAAKGRPIYRSKPILHVKKEIEHLFSNGHRRFFIIDEAITPQRLQELSDIFSSLPETVSWIGYIRLDNEHTRDNFISARASGCLKLFIGVETGSDRLLQRFNKGVTSSQARRVLTDIASANLAAHFFLMTGFPEENETDREATLNLLSDVLPFFDPFGISFDLFALTGELETDLMKHPHDYGWSGPKKNSNNDLAWQFPILSGNKATEEFVNFKNRIYNLADRILGNAFGLRHASLAQDSLHLLLLEARIQQRLNIKK